MVQPEPGCSEPTFVGSAADLDHHAPSLLNIGLVRVASLQVSQASLDLVSAPWLERKKRERPLLHYEFEHYQTYLERKHAFQVLQSSAAKCGVLAEIARIARVRSSKKIERASSRERGGQDVSIQGVSVVLKKK